MFQKPTKQLILIGLGGLLAIQLTGLSCLNDWQQGDALNGAHAQYRATQGTDGPDLPAADGCPCHLTFSFPFRLLVIASGPTEPLLIEIPETFLPTLASFVFHPPALL